MYLLNLIMKRTNSKQRLEAYHGPIDLISPSKQLNDGIQDQNFACEVNGYLGLDYVLCRKI